MRQLPHVLTVLRLIAAPFIAWLLFQARFREALAAALVAGLTDWFDGFAARRLRATAKLGAILDPVADKVLLETLFVVLGVIGLFPVWLVALAVGRDVVIVIGALLLRFLRNIRQFLPSTLGKVSTFFQIILVLLALLNAAFPNAVFLWLRNIGVVLATWFTALSGFDYVRRGIEMANREPVSQP